MENWKLIFEWVSIAFGGITGLTAIVFAVARIFGRNLLDEWFARKNKQYQVKLDAELATYKSELDSRLEVLKISYGNVFSERMSIFKEACKRMQKIEDFCNILASYKNYDCRDKVDYEKPCDKDCPKGCIVNYSKVVFEMRNYLMKTDNWFASNEFFFSLDQYEEILNINLEFLALLNKAIKIIGDLSLSEKERAFKCFDIFAEFKMDNYRVARKRLIETFRYAINVPLLSKSHF